MKFPIRAMKIHMPCVKLKCWRNVYLNLPYVKRQRWQKSKRYVQKDLNSLKPQNEN